MTALRRYVHDVATHNRRAADRVVPWLMEQVGPGTVLDVGCGLGTWAAVFGEHGCEAWGVDTEEVPPDLLAIPHARFRVVDLEMPLQSMGRFDLAVCLEVMEHISADAGDRLVRFLTETADTILFSAAVPGQGGSNHVNEQWPAYWQARFRRYGFDFDDAVRWRFWDDEEVDWWYRQNMVLARRCPRPLEDVQSVVHPRCLERRHQQIADFYRGAVPLRTGIVVVARSLLRAVGWMRDG